MKKRRTTTKRKGVPTKTLKRVVVRSSTKSSATTAHKKIILRLGFSMKSLHVGMHVLIAVSAIGVLFALGAIDRDRFATRMSNAAVQNTATIGLAYKDPLLLSVLIAKKTDAGYVAITNNSNQEIKINTLAAWSLLETTNATLDSIITGVPTFGFTERTVPAKAGIKLAINGPVPDALFFDTVSSATAAITMKTVNLSGDTPDAASWVVLLRKNNLVRLWGEQ